MKRIATVISILLLATAALAQEPAKFRTRMFELRNAVPREVYLAIKPLGSGAQGSDLSFNNDTHTITVRDYPENIATMEEAIGRLDRPQAASANVDLKISLLIGSKVVLPGPSVPDDLAPVVKQLESTLRYSHYGLMAANIQRTKAGEGIEGSGVAEPTLIGMAASAEHPVFYNYRLRNIRVDSSGDRASVNVEKFEFSMRVPVRLDKGIQYQNVGFDTPVSIREGEKVVIGTTTMGDRAVIVVLMAGIGGK
jgi:hypothetical protein